MQIVRFKIAPHMLCCNIVRVHIDVVRLAVREDQVSRSDLRAVERLEAHGVGDVSVKFSDRFVARVGTHVGLSKAVSDLAEPGLATDALRNARVAGKDVHVDPVPVVEVVPPLVVHFHVVKTLDGQVARSSSTAHLTVVNETLISGAHSIEVLVILIADKDNLRRPLVVPQVFADECLSRTALLQRNNGHKILLGQSLGSQTGRCRVLQQKFLDASSDIFSAKFSFSTLIAWSKENDSLIIIKLVLFAELVTNILNALLEVGGEVLLADTQFVTIVGEEVSEAVVFGVNVLDSIEDAVLADVFRGEREAVRFAGLEGQGVVHVVDVLHLPLVEVLDEAVHVVAFGAV